MQLSRENGFFDVGGHEQFIKKGVLYADDDPVVQGAAGDLRQGVRRPAVAAEGPGAGVPGKERLRWLTRTAWWRRLPG